MKSVPSTLNKRFKTMGYTFDDVLLQPAYTTVLPNETEIKTALTNRINLNIPFLSAAMDTVTEYQLATALAREGGLGVIHKNMSIDEQQEQVKKVKRSESGVIQDPITLPENATLGDAVQLKNKYQISGILIVGKNKILVGILTNRDIRFETNMSKPVTECMTSKGLITTPAGTSLKQAESILNKYRIEKLPVVNKKGILVGLFTYRDILQLQHHPYAIKGKDGRLLVGAAVGTSKDYMERVEALHHAEVDIIVLDSAHGHSETLLKVLRSIKKKYKNHLQIMAGNIATKEAAIALQKAGADAVKVGIGPGSICTTRVVTGVGVPQLSAIMEVAHTLKESNTHVVADGGIRYTGDVVKALAAGASAVMMGSVFSGTIESPGEPIIFEGRKFKQYRGMGSIAAMQKGSADRYFQKNKKTNSVANKLVPEGIEGRVAFKGSLKEVVFQYVGGLRSGMGYCGAKSLKHLQKATFVPISSAGILESHPHNIEITKEASNYSRG